MLNICHDPMTRADCKDRSRNADWQPVWLSIRPIRWWWWQWQWRSSWGKAGITAAPPLSLSVDLQCKTTEMPRLKSLTKEINLGKLSSFCSSPVSGELHAPINVTLATKNYAQFRSVSRSDPIRSKNAWSNIFFSSFFLSSITDFLLSAILLALFFFLCCARETVTMKKDFWSVVFVAMAYLKLWPTSDARTQIRIRVRIRRRRGPFKTSSKLILAAKTVKCCEKNAKANPRDTKSNFYQLKDPRRDHHHHPHDHHLVLGLANDE